MKKFLPILLILASVYSFGQQVDLLYHWQDTTLPASADHNNTYNEVWGFSQDNREYGVIGSTMGTHFFDVTDKNNISYIDFIPGKAQGPDLIHRDYHDYNGYLYAVADEGPSSLQIIDLSHLPDSASLVYDSDEHFVRSHNIFIDTAKAKLYVCNIKVYVYSLANPINPTLITTIDMPSHSHDLYVRNDTAYINAGPNGLLIYDVSTTNPALLGSISIYPQKGYNHSGWLTDDGNTYIFADEDHGMEMKVLDVSDFNDLTVFSTFMTMTDPKSIAHNQIIKDNYLYVSQYFDGFHVYDISDINNISDVGSYATSSIPVTDGKYEGAWGVFPFLNDGKVLVSDMQEGFFVLDVSGVTTNTQIHEANTGFKMYPNPASSFVMVSSEIGDFITISDVSGKTIYRGNSFSHITNINTSGFNSGVYLVECKSATKTTQQKLIIK